MKPAGIILVLLLALLSMVISCRQDQLTATEAVTLMDSLEHKLEWLDYRINRETWQLYTRGEADSLQFYRGLYDYVISDERTFRTLQQAKPLLDTEIDQRRRELLFATLVQSRAESRPDISRLRDSLAQVDINYRAEFEGKQQTAGALYRIYRTDKNPIRREIAYRAWCSVGLELADGLERLVRLRNQAARRLGYNNYLALVFKLQGLKQSDYLSLLNRLDSLSLEPYQAILQGVEETLSPDDIEIWDLAYSYAGINAQVDAHFPADSQMPYIRSSLEKLGFNLDKLPIWFDLQPRPGKSQLAYAFPMKSPYDIRVLANQTDGLYSTRVLLHEIGHAVHFAHVAQERPLFNNALSPGWIEGTAQIAAALCDEEDWLRDCAGMSPELISRHLEAKRQQDIIYLRTTLMRLYFEYRAYVNPERDLNRLYWDLFEQYLMLPRHDELKPWAAIIHYTTHPVYLHNYLLGDILAAQTVAYLHENYGSIAGNPAVNSFLIQNYYRFGGRYPWRELLERGTGETLNPQYLIDHLTG
ncbi:MAG: hypothetical protein ABII79_14415 [bacterium]